ncbi:uncharacterized protein KY384_008652 [Bacidia gigantensis]|uniref:uncharacterized protein n=1 Tax=Bacidia gigantensis TaxID=2732470 RepID=UPI001D03C162|nr:uncharacterized protein KY384_008652 [Bacidia gigantensis]KAG8527222.1 hypothetical protein KY384_008652 [Bacidia gigantensis]
MTKPKDKSISKSGSAPDLQPPITLQTLRENLDLWYRLRVLLHDFNNVKDPRSEQRLSCTTHPLYISPPYFSDADSSNIRTALLVETSSSSATFNEETITLRPEMTVEEAIHGGLSNFLEGRKASGDARPCGLHDMLPIYSAVFGILKEQLKDERFISRVRKAGLGDAVGKEQCAGQGGSEKKPARGKGRERK